MMQQTFDGELLTLEELENTERREGCLSSSGSSHCHNSKSPTRQLSPQETLRFEHPDEFNQYWDVYYIDSDEIVHRHGERADHYIRVARAINRDHNWYGLLHIGNLSPTDPRYTGDDRRPFDSYAEARTWACLYMNQHPDGIDPSELQEFKLHYDWEIDEEFHIDRE